jgi:hypothetical protein
MRPADAASEKPPSNRNHRMLPRSHIERPVDGARPGDTKSIVSRHGVWWQKTNPLSECRFAARRGTLRSICEGARTRLRSVYLIVCSM